MPRRINQNEKVVFSVEFDEFKEKEEKQGSFEGIAVNYKTDKVANGIYKFAPNSLKANAGKTLVILYNHEGSVVPIGTGVGKDTEDGFMFSGNFQLTKDEAGNSINKNAAAIYDLIKNFKAKLELSVGGHIIDGGWEVEEKNGKTQEYIRIKKFQAKEVSVVVAGAVQGSKITNIFREENGGNEMTAEELKLFLEQFLAKFKQEIVSAGTDEEIKKLPLKFKEMETLFREGKEKFETGIKTDFEKKFSEINEVIKGLRADYKPTAQEVSFATQYMAMLRETEKKGTGVTTSFAQDDTINFSESPATTDNTAVAVRPEYVTKILERIQEKNPLIKDVNFISTSENSYFIPREMLELPQTGWIGETSTREVTKKNDLDSVTVNLYQIYSMPVVSNRMLATNFVGYLNFLLARVEYALGLKLSNTLLTGTGVQQPKGILVDTNVKQKYQLDPSTDEALAKSIIGAYYSVREEIASTSKWYFMRKTWEKIAQITSTDGKFMVTDLNKGSTRSLMGRPVEIIESSSSGLKDFGTTVATDTIGLFANVNMAIIGLVNPKLDIKVQDQITNKGLTGFYQEKLIGMGVQLPEYIVKLSKKI